MNKLKKNNVVSFPPNITEDEREIEAILFAASEPLDIDTIESKISKKINALKVLEKLQATYSTRGINLVCISNKWSFRTAENLSKLMSQQKNIDELIPKNFKTSKSLKRTGKAGIFAASLELVKEGNITIKQDKYFDNIYIRENK